MNVLFLVADEFEDLEFFCPYYRLIEACLNVTVATPDGKDVKGKHGYIAKSSAKIEEVNPEEYDILLIPGGKSPERIRLINEALHIVKHFFQHGKLVATICHGPQVLISAGVLKGRRITCWIGIRDDVMLARAAYIDQEVVRDENLISSRKPNDLPYFCSEIIKALKEREVETT